MTKRASHQNTSVVLLFLFLRESSFRQGIWERVSNGVQALLSPRSQVAHASNLNQHRVL